VAHREVLPWLKAGLSLTMLLFMIRLVDWEKLWTVLRTVSLSWFFLAVVANSCQLTLGAWRWQILLRMFTGEQLPLIMLVRYYFVGGFFNNFAPANLGGDAMRIGILFNQGRDKFAATGSVVLERLFNLAGLLLLITWVLLFQIIPISLQPAASIPIHAGFALLFVLLVCAGMLFIWLHWQQVAGICRRLLELARHGWQHPGLAGQAGIITLLQHITMMLITLCTFNAVGVALPAHFHLAVYAMAALALTFPITIQGVGVREGVYVGLMTLAGVGTEDTLAALALNYLLLIGFSVPGAVMFWLAPGSVKPQPG
jgi:glycosyltransferase 2 family protein